MLLFADYKSIVCLLTSSRQFHQLAEWTCERAYLRDFEAETLSEDWIKSSPASPPPNRSNWFMSWFRKDASASTQSPSWLTRFSRRALLEENWRTGSVQHRRELHF